MEYLLCQFFTGSVAVWNPAPEEHTDTLGVIAAMEHIHYLFSDGTTTFVILVVILLMPLISIVISLCCCQLDAPEGARVDITLYLQYPRDKFCIGSNKSYTPSGHVVTLRHRIELYAAFFCSWYLQQRLWTVIDDEGVRVVINYNDIMFLSKANKTFVGSSASVTASRHVWIVRPHQFYLAEVHRLQLLKIRLPAIILLQVVVDNLLSENLAEGCICGISGIWHKYFVTRIAESKGDMKNALLRTNEGKYFSL